MNKVPRSVLAIKIVLLIIIADQILKIWIKTNLFYGEEIVIASWFKIKFVENEGMAFGMNFINKLFLTTFRILAVGFIIYYLRKIIKEKLNYGYIVCISLILAGAFGNIIDCVFYGEIFTESTPWQKSELVAIGEGYGTWMHGKVVDMFYFPLIESTYPSWFPVVGGQPFEFFSAIFNIADAAISVGFVLLFIFYRNVLLGKTSDKKVGADEKVELEK